MKPNKLKWHFEKKKKKLPPSSLHPGGGGSKVLWNVESHHNVTVSQPRRPWLEMLELAALNDKHMSLYHGWTGQCVHFIYYMSRFITLVPHPQYTRFVSKDVILTFRWQNCENVMSETEICRAPNSYKLLQIFSSSKTELVYPW